MTGKNREPRQDAIGTHANHAGAIGMAFALVIIAGIALIQAFSAAAPANVGIPPVRSWYRAMLSIGVGAALAAWAPWVRRRCSDAAIARNLCIVAELLAAWILLVLVKYDTNSPEAASFMWYCYYIPMLSVPSLGLFSIIRAAALDATPATRMLRRCVIAVDAALILTVLTNSLHFQVFQFDLADPKWSSNYTYGPGYWAVMVWTAGKVIAFFVVAYLAGSRRLRRLLPLVGAVLGVGSIYCALYILEVEAVRATNLALVYSIVALVAFETCLATGLFPSYRDYSEAFRRLPLDLKVLGRDGRVAFATDAALPLPPSVQQEVMRFAQRTQTQQTMFRVNDCPHRVFAAYRLSGGVALFSADVSDADMRSRQLEQRKSELASYNELLERNLTVQRRLHAQQAEGALADEVERSLANALVHMGGLLDMLRECGDAGGSASPLSPEGLHRTSLLAQLRVLLAYCKRKGALVLGEQEGRPLSTEALGLMAAELGADLRAAGVPCLCMTNLERPVSAPVASALFDCLHACAMACAARSEASALFVIGEAPSGAAIEVRVSLEMSEEGRARSQAFDPDELARSLREAAPCVLSAEVTSEDDSLNAIILLERRLP